MPARAPERRHARCQRQSGRGCQRATFPPDTSTVRLVCHPEKAQASPLSATQVHIYACISKLSWDN